MGQALPAFALLLLAAFLPAQETGRVPAEVCLVIDTAGLAGAARAEALAWLSGEVVDGVMRDGDGLTVWRTGGADGKAELVFSGVLSSGGREAVKRHLAAGETAPSGAARPAESGLPAALEAASARLGKPVHGKIGFILLVTGSSPSALTGPGMGILRYSRVREFHGWRVLTAAPGIEARVKKAAADFMAGN